MTASRISEAQLATTCELFAAMRAAHSTADMDGLVEVDLGFRDVILRTSGQVFMSVLHEPLGRALSS
ncbi:FCD domain-containing protein [Glutamicibacter mysorens]|uniref:FCD domain-containing protein n=1 Tax=Glutamicibacter mysorens TaxID=257984 RepID=UPI0012EEAF96|nr:FCD domain-containing protein [Glutamicibacter mysorens]